jgi:hypothetical protein
MSEPECAGEGVSAIGGPLAGVLVGVGALVVGAAVAWHKRRANAAAAPSSMLKAKENDYVASTDGA